MPYIQDSKNPKSMGGEEWIPEWMKSITGRNKQFEKLGSREGRNANNHRVPGTPFNPA